MIYHTHCQHILHKLDFNMAKNNLKRTSVNSRNIADMMKRKKSSQESDESSSSQSPLSAPREENRPSSPSVTTNSMSTPVARASPASSPCSSEVVEKNCPSSSTSKVKSPPLLYPLSKEKFDSIPEVDDTPHQPKNFEFPARQFGNSGTRKFRTEWFQKYPWLHYDESSDRVNVSLSKCRGQCYDGCSTMKGEKNGVAKRIKDIEKKALFTHCYTHSLNLAVGDAIKGSKIMKEALETTHEITKLIKKSPKRDAKLESLKKEMDVTDDSDKSQIETVTLLCPTRWTVRAKSLGSIISNFSFLKDLWEWAVDNCSDTDMKARIRGVDVYMRTFYIYRE